MMDMKKYRAKFENQQMHLVRFQLSSSSPA